MYTQFEVTNTPKKAILVSSALFLSSAPSFCSAEYLILFNLFFWYCFLIVWCRSVVRGFCFAVCAFWFFGLVYWKPKYSFSCGKNNFSNVKLKRMLHFFRINIFLHESSPFAPVNVGCWWFFFAIFCRNLIPILH